LEIDGNGERWTVMQSKKRRVRLPHDPLADIADWVTPEAYEKEFPLIATAYAITRDVWNRHALGLEKLGAIRKVGRRCLVHRKRYTAYRLGELRP
jgi:hypothetical protein